MPWRIAPQQRQRCPSAGRASTCAVPRGIATRPHRAAPAALCLLRAEAPAALWPCAGLQCATSTAPLPSGTPRHSAGLVGPCGATEGRSAGRALCSVMRLCILQGPSLPGCSNFHFHEEMKHFILYDFPTMAVIPFHLSGRRR